MFHPHGKPSAGTLLALLLGFGGPGTIRAAEPDPEVKAKLADKPELGAFVDLYLNDSYSSVEDAGYVALPDDLLADSKSTFEDAGVDKIRAEPGQDVYKLTPEQTALWKKASEPLIKTWADSVKKAGVDPDSAMAELRASLAKYHALAQ